MKRVLLFRMLGCVCVMLLGLEKVYAETWNVPAEALTIAAAIDSASNGDIINVTQASYSENGFTIYKSITLSKSPASIVTISATSTQPAVLVTASNVIVKGMVLRGYYLGAPAVRIEESGAVLEDCTITTSGSAWWGVVGNTDLTVRRCTFTNLLSPAVGPTLSGHCESPIGSMTVDTCVFDGCYPS